MAIAHPVKMPRSAVEMSGTKKGATLYVDDKRSLLAALEKLADGPIVLRIDPAGDVRGLALNARYFAVLRDIATHRNDNEADAHHTTESLHQEYKARFNGGATTTTLSPQLMSIYLERIMAHAATEHGVEFPTPERLV